MLSQRLSRQTAPKAMPSVSARRGASFSRTALAATNSRELRFFGGSSYFSEIVELSASEKDSPNTPSSSKSSQSTTASKTQQSISIVPQHSHTNWLYPFAQMQQPLTVGSLVESWNKSQSRSITTNTKIYKSVASATTTTHSTTVHVSSSSCVATTNTIFRSFSSSSFVPQGGGERENNNHNESQGKPRPVLQGYGSSLILTDGERQLFGLLRRVRKDTHLDTTLRVAGGWVRDKLLATPEFSAYHAVFGVAGKRLTSKFRQAASRNQRGIPTDPTAAQLDGRLGSNVLSANDAAAKPVDIDIALDDMLGREFAEHLNEYLSAQGEETHSVGVVLKNPEKSKHLETATMKVGTFWIDFVNLRAEEYTQDSRIPDLMRIGNPSEDAFRRDLTINALFYNINTGQVEDWTGRGFEDLRKGIVATPLPSLTTLLDDPLRVLRSIRFAARLRFTMDEELVRAAKDVRVRTALAQKVSRERVGSEVELMLRSPDPVGAMRLLFQLNLMDTVFPQLPPDGGDSIAQQGLSLLSTAHDHLADCKWSPPLWCHKSNPAPGLRLLEDGEARRLLWYTSLLKPLWDFYKQDEESRGPLRQSKKQKRKSSPVQQLLVDDLKRPTRDAEAIAKILKSADEITDLLQNGSVVSSTMILLSDISVREETQADGSTTLQPLMSGRRVDPLVEADPVWVHAMEFRLTCFKLLQRIGPLWRAALILSLSEELTALQSSNLEYAIEGDIVDESQEERRRGIIERYDIFAAALLRLGLLGSWDTKPLLDGGAVKKILPHIPKGPVFRDIMEEQTDWVAMHPGADAQSLTLHLKQVFPDFAADSSC